MGMPLYGQPPLSDRTLDSREVSTAPDPSQPQQERLLPAEPRAFMTITTQRGDQLRIPANPAGHPRYEGPRRSVNSSQVRAALDQIRKTNDEYSHEPGQQSTHGSFRPLNTKELRLPFDEPGAGKDYEGKRFNASGPSSMRVPSHGSARRESSPESAANKVIKVAKITAKRMGPRAAIVKRNADRVLYGTDKPLDSYTINVLRQRTLYKMQRSLW